MQRPDDTSQRKFSSAWNIIFQRSTFKFVKDDFLFTKIIIFPQRTITLHFRKGYHIFTRNFYFKSIFVEMKYTTRKQYTLGENKTFTTDSNQVTTGCSYKAPMSIMNSENCQHSSLFLVGNCSYTSQYPSNLLHGIGAITQLPQIQWSNPEKTWVKGSQ